MCESPTSGDRSQFLRRDGAAYRVFYPDPCVNGRPGLQDLSLDVRTPKASESKLDQTLRFRPCLEAALSYASFYFEFIQSATYSKSTYW